MAKAAKQFKDLIAEALNEIQEIQPWDLEDYLEENPNVMLLDVREQDEFNGAHLKHSIHVPRGILEQACEWNFAETVPELVNAKQRPIVVVCRSGNRSALAALTMKIMGYENLVSLKLGIKGGNDSDVELINNEGDVVDPDWADDFFNPPVSHEQLSSNH